MDDLLKPKDPPPAPKTKPGLLGSGEPECEVCGNDLDDSGFCPVCQPGDDPFEIDL